MLMEQPTYGFQWRSVVVIQEHKVARFDVPVQNAVGVAL